jgi:hypothetical protein
MAIIVAGTALLCAVAAEIIVFAETGTRAQKPIPADPDETFGPHADGSTAAVSMFSSRPVPERVPAR